MFNMYLSTFKKIQVQENMCPTFEQIYEKMMKVQL
jgi:hypothetical protein